MIPWKFLKESAVTKKYFDWKVNFPTWYVTSCRLPNSWSDNRNHVEVSAAVTKSDVCILWHLRQQENSFKLGKRQSLGDVLAKLATSSQTTLIQKKKKSILTEDTFIETVHPPHSNSQTQKTGNYFPHHIAKKVFTDQPPWHMKSSIASSRVLSVPRVRVHWRFSPNGALVRAPRGEGRN